MRDGRQLSSEASRKVIDFLDVALNLNNGTYSSCTLGNNKPFYIHRGSNHPPMLVKNIPAAASECVSGISSGGSQFMVVQVDALPGNFGMSG